MKIVIIDSWQKFAKDIADFWRKTGHQVRYRANYDERDLKWADLVWFDVIDNNLVQASKRSDALKSKPPSRLIGD